MVDIVVVGSLNIDFVIAVERMPTVGETILGKDFHMIPGGKGANQAAAIARLGGKVALVGCVGDDIFGDILLKGLTAEGVDVSMVRRSPEAFTGVASIAVDALSQNSIIVAPGSNWLCGPEKIDSAANLIQNAKILMLQLEIPLETVEYAASFAKKIGKTVILDPAPALPLSSFLLSNVDIITPNENETEKLTGREIRDIKSARLAAADIMAQGVKTVSIKMGPRGVLWAEGNHIEHLDGFPVKAVDSTAAGDAFNAGLAVGLAEGLYFQEALKLANAAGALTTTRFGAQTSLPARNDVEELLAARKC